MLSCALQSRDTSATSPSPRPYPLSLNRNTTAAATGSTTIHPRIPSIQMLCLRWWRLLYRRLGQRGNTGRPSRTKPFGYYHPNQIIIIPRACFSSPIILCANIDPVRRPDPHIPRPWNRSTPPTQCNRVISILKRTGLRQAINADRSLVLSYSRFRILRFFRRRIFRLEQPLVGPLH